MTHLGLQNCDALLELHTHFVVAAVLIRLQSKCFGAVPMVELVSGRERVSMYYISFQIAQRVGWTTCARNREGRTYSECKMGRKGQGVVEIRKERKREGSSRGERGGRGEGGGERKGGREERREERRGGCVLLVSVAQVLALFRHRLQLTQCARHLEQ
jgi:hypothetical protein